MVDRCVICGEIIPEGGWVCQCCYQRERDEWTRVMANAAHGVSEIAEAMRKRFEAMKTMIDPSGKSDNSSQNK
jgi:hypothetical protein